MEAESSKSLDRSATARFAKFHLDAVRPLDDRRGDLRISMYFCGGSLNSV